MAMLWGVSLAASAGSEGRRQAEGQRDSGAGIVPAVRSAHQRPRFHQATNAARGPDDGGGHDGLLTSHMPITAVKNQ